MNSIFQPARAYDAFLFDMDGTILTSIPAVERAWTAWAERVGVPTDEVMAYLHGRPARDTISRFAPKGSDVAAEVAWLDAREIEDIDGVAPIAGAASFLSALPADRWAVVTSANRALALVRIKAAGLPLPRVLVSSDDVHQGKPHPEGFLLGARTLGFPVENCLVFEDTGAGLAAGRAAGAALVRIAGDHDGDGPDGVATITDYTGLRVMQDKTGLHLAEQGAVAKPLR